MISYRKIIKPLMSYTDAKFTNMTPDKKACVRLIYEIMREAIVDLHQKGSRKLQKDAIDYFKSDLFDLHCCCVAIPKKLMLRIVESPEKYLQKPLPFELHESSDEL